MKITMRPKRMMLSRFLLFGLLMSGWVLGLSQLQVTPSNNATALVNQLIGPGIVVSNATITTNLNAAGTFVSNGSNIGLPAGVLLTSGEVANAVGPNSSTGISTAHFAPGDAQLDVLTAPFLTEDACILEFDMVATCDTIQISYVFGSDEYDEWVCSDFTDAFAFFISGPGIVGAQNIAVIPGSTTPVSINTVNIGSVGVNAFPPYPTNCNTTNSSYFTTNNVGTTIEYDGFTVPLIAKSAVLPCSTYHIKLVIADAGDAALDSGVFLEQNGIRCTSTAIAVASSINSPGYVNAIEGCVSGRFTFTRSGDTTVAQTVNYTVGGTATPGFDYPLLPGSVTFPPMVSSVVVNVIAAADGISELTESVQLILTDSVCSTVFSDTATLFISDQIAISAGPNSTICQGNTAQMGLPPLAGVTYNWLPPTSLNNAGVSNPVFANPNPGIYHYTLLGIDTSGCQGGDTMTIQVLLSPTPNFTVDPDVCEREITAITYTGNAPANANYNWSFPGGTLMSGSGQGPLQVRWNTAGSYTVSLTVSQGVCASLPESHAVVVHSKPIVTLNPTNLSCFQSATGSVSANIALGTFPFTFSWSNGASSPSINNLPAGNYSLTLTDTWGCGDTAAVTLTEPPLLTDQFVVVPIVCNGGTGTATITPAGGTLPYTYLWSTGQNTPSITPTTGVYTVTVTDAQGCSITETANMPEAPLVAVSISGDSIACVYEQVTLTAVPGGGVPPYQYSWSSLPIGLAETTPAITIDALQDRFVVLDITDSLGCPGHATLFVDATPSPVIAFQPDILEACDEATVTFVNSTTPPNSSFLWTFQDGSTSIAVSPSHFFTNGIWGAQLTATSPEGCVSSLNLPALVTILPTPVASFETEPNITLVDYLLLSQATITFNNNSPFFAQAVNWSFGNGDSAFVGQVTYTYPEAGLYAITMTAYNAFGCHDDTTQSLLILNDPALWVPSGFTPNGDGLNDLFMVAGLEVKTYAIEIFDRWGKLIYRSNDILKGWDGLVEQQFAPEGVYVYKIVATTNTGPVRKSGSVTLIR